jgi:hypothetical protein
MPNVNPAAGGFEQLPMQTRALPISSVNAEARTIDVVFSTGATVRRVRWEGWDTRVPYDETLVVSADAIDMTRLEAGAPVLDSHSPWSTRSQLAVVERAWIEGGKAMARFRFPTAGIDENSDRAFALAKEGILRNVSVGYSIDKVRVVEPEKRGEVEQWVIERWTPFEISFVTIPADAGAQTRQHDQSGEPPRPADQRLFPATVTRTAGAASHNREQENRMDKTEDAAVQTQPETNPTLETAATRSAAAPDANAILAAERKRTKEIRSICASLGFPEDKTQQLIDDGVSLDAARSAIIDWQVENSAARSIVGGGASASVKVTDPGVAPAERRDAMAEALYRSMPGANPEALYGKRADAKPSDRIAKMSEEFRGLSIVNLSREYFGISYRMNPAQVFDEVQKRAALGTSDFPLLLSAAANKFLLQQYTYQEPNYRRIAAKASFKDFKEHKFLRLGDMSRLEKLAENGEVRQGKGPSERQNTMSAGTYGVIHKFTRQMYINDDLNAFADMASAAGRGAIEDENYLAWQVILANSGAGPTLTSDNKAVFHADHKNVGTAADINVSSLGEARQKMREQKSLDGRPLSGNVPTIILAGPAKETALDQILSTNMLATQFSNIVPNGMQRLTPVIDAYITGNSWYVFADPAWRPVFRWGYVDGSEGPRFTLDQPFNYDGLALKVMLDFGFGAVDYVGAVRNAGN